MATAGSYILSNSVVHKLFLVNLTCLNSFELTQKKVSIVTQSVCREHRNIVETGPQETFNTVEHNQRIKHKLRKSKDSKEVPKVSTAKFKQGNET